MAEIFGFLQRVSAPARLAVVLYTDPEAGAACTVEGARSPELSGVLVANVLTRHSGRSKGGDHIDVVLDAGASVIQLQRADACAALNKIALEMEC